MVAWYQLAVRAFIWPAIYACPDLAYSIRVFGQFCNNPKPMFIELVKHDLRYISEILDLYLTFNKEANIANDMIKYTDSDFTRSKID